MERAHLRLVEGVDGVLAHGQLRHGALGGVVLGERADALRALGLLRAARGLERVLARVRACVVAPTAHRPPLERTLVARSGEPYSSVDDARLAEW